MTEASQLVLEAKTALLRGFDAADIDGVSALVGDDRVTRWLSFDSLSRPEAAVMLEGILERQQAKPRTEYYFAVAEIDAPREVIGFVRLGLGGVKAADIGYATRPEWQGKGITKAAVARMIDFGFSNLGLHRLTANIGPENTASRRLVESLGFQREGQIRDHVFTNGAWRDSVSYSLLEHEWPAHG